MLLLPLLLLPLAQICGAGPLQVTPDQWDFGVIPDSQSIHLLVSVRNTGTEAVRVSFLPTCECLFAPPGSVEIPAQGEQDFRLIFDPAGYEGQIDKDFILRSTAEGQEKALFRVHGEVRPGQVAAGNATNAESPAHSSSSSEVHISYVFSAGCRSCERFLANQIPALERELGILLQVERIDIFDSKSYERYLQVLRRLGVQERAYPAVIAGARVLQGDSEIEAGLREALLSLAGEGRADPLPPGGPASPKRIDLTALPVIAAGLLDGVNPCAFTTLIFLVSALAVAGKSRRQMLVLGLVYSATVFVTYFLIGLGFLSAIRYAQSFTLIAAVIRWVLVTALLLFAGLSLHDYVQLRRGRTGRVLLQLPSALKKQIHASIRTHARSAALAGSAVVLGFLVTVFELACTGQVYLPTIVYSVRTSPRISGYGYLLLYNIGFIVPLLAVFTMSLAGLGIKSLTAFFQKGVAVVKLAMAALFLLLAALTVLF